MPVSRIACISSSELKTLLQIRTQHAMGLTVNLRIGFFFLDLRPTLGDYSGPLKIRRELGALSPSSAGVSRVIQTLCWHNSDKRVILAHSSKGDTDNTGHELCSMYSTTNCTLVRSNLLVSEYRMYAVSGCWEETTFNEYVIHIIPAGHESHR